MVRIKTLTTTSIVLVISIFVFITSGHAVTQLDQSFGTDGKVVDDFGYGDDAVLDVMVQEDGKILAVGYAYNGAVKNVVVARYLQNGDLDDDFNNDGVFSASLGTGDSLGHSILLQEDGKMVVAATSSGDASGLVLLRLTDDGFGDMTFGEDGRFFLSVDDDAIESASLKQGRDAEIIVAGTAASEVDGRYVYISRFSQDGFADETFAEEGLAVLKKDESVSLKTFEVLADNSIIGAGSVTADGQSKISLYHWRVNGSLDPEFDEDGEKILGLAGVEIEINDSLVDSEGKLYLAGGLGDGNTTTALVVKVDQYGEIVSEFGEGGLYLNNLGSQSVANDMILLEGGRLLIVGYIETDDGKDIFVQTIDQAGNIVEIEAQPEEETEKEEPLSPQVVVEGVVIISSPETADDEEQGVPEGASYLATDFFSSDDIGNSVAALPDGGVVVAGSSANGSDTDFALLRYSGKILAAAEIDTNGVTTEDYRVVTSAVTEITRVGGTTGGEITDVRTLSCETSCTAECSSNSNDCYDDCLSDCQDRPTVTTRGVVFATEELPVYDDETGDDEDEDSSEGDTTSSEDDSSTPSIFPQGDLSAYDIVRSGQTDDGEGEGSFISEIEDITPNTTYYVRAYALLSDDTVVYGNVVSFKTDDACFIATAAFGSILERHVEVLREFRDRFLMGHDFGRLVVGMYYKYSPALADRIEESEILRGIVRIFLIPVVGAAAIVVYGTVPLLVCMLCMVIGGGLLMLKAGNSRKRLIKVG